MKMRERLIFFGSHEAKNAALEPMIEGPHSNQVFKGYAEKRTAAEKRTTPAVTEGDCEKHFGFATLGSFRKNKGDPDVCRRFRLTYRLGADLFAGPRRPLNPISAE